MDNGDQNLINLLKQIPNQYSDFISSVAVIIKNYQIGDEVKEYLVNHPDATTDDVIKYMYLKKFQPIHSG